MARVFYSETAIVPTIEFIFPAPIPFPSFSLLDGEKRAIRSKRDLVHTLQKDKGRTFAQLIPLFNNSNLLSGISFVISNGATLLFVVFIIIHLISLVTGSRRRSFGGEGISPLFDLGRLDDPKTLSFLSDLPKYLEYADIGRLLEYGFQYLDITEPDCQMRSVCEAQQFIKGRSETVAMIIKSLR